MVLPCYYLAPVSYYALLLMQGKSIFIEQYDHYERQTYRNRCRIYGGNGRLDLTVPVVKHQGRKNLMRDVLIDYDEAWQQIHWKSIASAYTNSPFYEFVADSYIPFFENKTKYLVDLNIGLLNTTLDLLSIDCTPELTGSFSKPEAETDLFKAIHPKRELQLGNIEYTPLPYVQVFDDIHGFLEDLSIIDLLCNMGNEARIILKQSIQKTE